MRTIDKVKIESEKYMKKSYFGGHDFSHVLRVHNLCKKLGKKEGADMEVLEAAALLHDLGREEERKNPEIDHAEKSAEIAEKILKEIGFVQDKIPKVLYAIKVHRFSKGVRPTTLEAKILQDADRIDISGAIGIAMTFAYGGAHNLELYDVNDPFGKRREVNEKKYILDHFSTKILKLADTMNTTAGKRMVERRTKFLKLFLRQFKKELEGRE